MHQEKEDNTGSEESVKYDAEEQEDAAPTELEKKDKELKDLTDTLKRVQAEFENFRKRIERENRMLLNCANEEIVKKLIPILENIRLAEQNESNQDEFVKGAKLIFEQLKEILKKEGLKEIESLGQKFDPNIHEAMLRVSAEQDGYVEQEIQKGYMLNDKVIVHPKVAVGKKDEDNKEDKEGGDNQDS